MKKNRVPVRRNGSATAAAQQVKTNRKPPASKGQGRAAPVGPFTPQEAAVLNEIAHSVDWNTPQELERAAEDSEREARDYRLAAKAIRRFRAGRRWKWIVAPDLEIAAAAREKDYWDAAQRHGRIIGKFIRIFGAMDKARLFLNELACAIEVGRGSNGVPTRMKETTKRLLEAGSLVLDFISEMKAGGLLDIELESAGAR
jgi:hypothetical protein